MSASGQLVMPKLGLTMEEGRIAKWAVSPGTRFLAGDVVVVIETDKIANDVEAPAAGEMLEHLAPEGAVLPVSAPIARWRLDAGGTATGPGGGSLHPVALPEESVSDVAAPAPSVAGKKRAATSSLIGASVLRPAAVSPDRISAGGRPRAQPAPLGERVGVRRRDGARRTLTTPYARRLAREAGLDIASVAGSGPGGRIKACDVMRAVAECEHARSSASFPAATALDMAPGGRLLAPDQADQAITDVVPHAPAGREQVGAARDLARSLSLAQIDVDTRGLREIERSLSASPSDPVRLALVVMAASRAMNVPAADAIGVETATAGKARHLSLGIDADKGLRAVAAAIREATAGNGTESAGGMLLVAQGSEHARLFAPAVPLGWTAMLGLGAEREVLRRGRDGEVAAAHTMTLAFSYDATHLSNAAALSFLDSLKHALEEPLALLAGQ